MNIKEIKEAAAAMPEGLRVPFLIITIRALLAERAKVKRAYLTFADHAPGCEALSGGVCTCGYTEDSKELLEMWEG